MPSAVESLLRDDVSTFLRRAERYELGPVSGLDLRHGLAVPLDTAGRQITTGALDAATESTGGYPFMIQLTGYQLFRVDDRPIIDLNTARVAIPAAQRRLGRLVHEPALADLSEIDRSFLAAMAHSDGPARMADIANCLGVDALDDATYAGQYRLRLLRADMIRPAGRGLVDFELPYLREYLRDHVATDLPSRTRPHRPDPPDPEASF